MMGRVMGSVLVLAVLAYSLAHSDLYQSVSDDALSVKINIVISILLAVCSFAALWAPCRLTQKQKKACGISAFICASNYMIWANYDIEEQETDLSANYLVPYMKSVCGMELTGYDRFLLDMRDELPVVSLHGCLDKNGTFYEKAADSKSPWHERLLDYHMLVYNHLFDVRNRTDEFFGGGAADAS